MAWRVSADLSSPVAGLRALHLQALHPLAMAGVDQHSDWRQDPVGRLAATSAYLATVTFGDRGSAERVAARVRRIHEHVRGVDTVTGRPYAAGDPALLLWVHATFVDSGIVAAALFGTPLAAPDSDRFVAEMVTEAELVGVPRDLVPASIAELEAYIASVRPELRCTPAARESMDYLLDPPGLDEDMAEIWQDVRDAAVAALPGWAREMYGYDAAAADRRPPDRDPPGARGARHRVPRRAGRARGAPADRAAGARGGAAAREETPARRDSVIGGCSAGLAVLGRRVGRLRLTRGRAALQLVIRGGLRYAGSAPRLFAAAGEHRQQLRNDLALQTAEDVATTLGAMKGVLMKIGQMASYVDDGLSPAVRRTLSRLQDSVPPMSAELAAGVVAEELGLPPEEAFARWDPEPIAAASIGQVHRAITHDGRAVAVKVQYPGIAETIAADLGNVALLRRMLRITAPAQDVDGAHRGTARPGPGRAGLPAGSGEPAAGGGVLRRPPHDHRPEDHRRAVHPAAGDQRAGRRRPLRRAGAVVPGRA